MNSWLKAHKKRTRQTAAMRLTDLINSKVTDENARQFIATDDQIAFCADLLGVSLWSDNGERAAIRLENKFLKAIK